MTDSGKKKRPASDVLMYPELAVDGMTEEKAMARAALDPATKATVLAKNFATAVPAEQLHSTELLIELMSIGRKAREGDLGGIEAMLAAQAYTLDAMFCSLAVRAKDNMGGYPQAAEMYMKLALKAQSQCRATAETLAMMKNPQPYIRQANLANQMQVNNGQPANFESNTRTPAQAREISPQPNELLTGGRHETVDYRRTPAAGRADPQLAALEKGDRRKN